MFTLWFADTCRFKCFSKVIDILWQTLYPLYCVVVTIIKAQMLEKNPLNIETNVD